MEVLGRESDGRRRNAELPRARLPSRDRSLVWRRTSNADVDGRGGRPPGRSVYEVSRRYGDYVRLAALLGLRAGELTALQVGDVDLTTGVVTIRRAFSAGELQTPKSRRVRQVPVVGELGPVLSRMTSGRRPAEAVLLGPLGGRLYHSNFRTKVRWPELVGDLAGRAAVS